ncbi:hypothetical protein F6X51_13980 [Methylobacterium planeticum]|uniref:PepSY domain-containing protein n=2 Tax=Methylobacterium planeticum TaxID=2615211 RepID=A0A6N6MU24_9HYPH|nr:hypothetical protein F6X51_13980 [Methylobacterium planeticum]
MIARALRPGLAAAALILAVGGAAQAQYVFEDEILSPRAVAWRLSERGFSGLSRPRFDGRGYVVEAFGPNGARLRLFVDAHDGAIVGRERLGADVYAPARVARPMPGFGWTEEDAEPRRPLRQAERQIDRQGERLLPPAEIPNPAGRALPPRPELYGRAEPVRPAIAGRPAPADANPLGVNPDARGRAEAPRKLSRLAPPKAGEAKPGHARTAPEAPAPKLGPAEAKEPSKEPSKEQGQEPGKQQNAARDPAQDIGKDAAKDVAKEAAQPQPKPETPVAAIEPPKAAPVPAQTPASVQPPPAEPKPPQSAAPETRDVEKAAEAKAPEVKPLEVKPAEKAWKDPPAEDKRNVRVIGGATIVPGGGEAGAAAD